MKVDTYHGTYIDKTEHHMYIAPPKELADIIAHYTITFPSTIPAACTMYHILPDASGCFIFQKDKTDFWGAMSEIVVLENDLQTAPERFFIEFLPSGLYQISGKEQRPYANMREELNVFDETIAKEAKEIYRSCSTYDELLPRMNAWLLERRCNYPLPKQFQEVKVLIDKEKGDCSLKSISEQCLRSPRQILREFHTYIGLSPKEYANILRFNNVVKQMRKDSLLETALEGGFFDQAHFNRMFKQIAQTSPTKYLHNLADFYNEFYKF